MTERMVYVYKSSKKLRTYLYIEEKDSFGKVPGALLDAFGKPKFMMALMLSKHAKLQKITHEELEKALSEKGYLLRMDLESEEESWLNEERRFRNLPPLTHEQIENFFH